MKKYIFVLVLGIFDLYTFAQENHFSQFYNSPQYINPALAGDVAYMRVAGTSRYMNPSPSLNILNSLVQYDVKLINYNTGLGILIYNHYEKLNHTKVQLNYSYTFQLHKNGWVKGGIGFSFNQKQSNATTLKYPDQYNDIIGYTGIPTLEPSLSDKSNFPAVSSGFVLYNNFVWFSLAADYLNKPKESFAGLESINPIKISCSTGFLVPLDKKKTAKRRFSKFGGLEPFSSIGPVFSYIQQGKYIEASGGCAFSFQPVYGGLHFRYQHDFRLPDNKTAYEALVFILGYRQEEISLSYSYDAALKNYSINRNGAHEISLAIYFSHFKEDFKRHALVPFVSQMLY